MVPGAVEMTVIVTVAAAKVPSQSATVWVKLSVPEKCAFGRVSERPV
jgi:hypothetical protein